MAFTHQSIYPSELKEAGAITLQVLGASFKSKFPNKRTKRPVFAVKVDIEGKEHYLNLDEESQAKAFDRYDGQTVEVLFDGTDVSIKSKGGSTSSANTTPATMDDAQGLANRVKNMFYFCERETQEEHAAAINDKLITESVENFGGKASNMFRVLERNGMLSAFPDDRLLWEVEQPPVPADA